MAHSRLLRLVPPYRPQVIFYIVDRHPKALAAEVDNVQVSRE